MPDDGILRFEVADPRAEAAPLCLITEAGAAAPTTVASSYLGGDGLPCPPREAFLRRDEAAGVAAHFALFDRRRRYVDPLAPWYRADGLDEPAERPRYALRPVGPAVFDASARYLQTRNPRDRSRLEEALRAEKTP